MSVAAGVQWGALEHAFGRAYDVPALLDAVSRARGNQLRRKMRDLCDRVLHQGTIYSASPPAVHELIGMSARASASDRAYFYEALVEFAVSARQALRDGHATACCSGGEPAVGAAILSEIAQARGRLILDLDSPEPAVRAHAGALLTAAIDTDAATVQLVRERYSAERDATVRLFLLESLERVRAAIPDWREFLAIAVVRETDTQNRCALRHAEIVEWKSEAAPAAVSELIGLCIAAEAATLFPALSALGPQRELDALLQAFHQCASREFLRPIAEHLLRVVFRDQRTGWDAISCSYVAEPGEAPSANTDWAGQMFKAVLKMLLLLVLGKVFPFLVRRKLRKAGEAGAKRVRNVEYWGLKGAAPELPVPLSPDQKKVLEALAAKPDLWFHRTNLWSLFGLPESAAGLAEFVAARQ